jgi:hypothetical protein
LSEKTVLCYPDSGSLDLVEEKVELPLHFAAPGVDFMKPFRPKFTCKL